MRYLLVVLLLACASASAQNVNELPLFGETQKSPEMIAADQRFVDSAVKAVGSREAASRMATFRGWQQLSQGDVEVAIQSFNQAYLLQPNNAEVYWGLGVAMSRQDKFEMAARLFERALILAPNNARLLVDVGVAHARAAIRVSQDQIEQTKRLQGALSWFDAAQKLEPGYAVIYANRALALYFLGNFTESWINVEKAEGIDRASVSAKLIANLSNKMPRPISSTATPAPDTATVKTEAVVAQADVQQSALPVPVRAPKIVMPKIPHGIPDEPAPVRAPKIVMPKIPHGIPDEPAPEAAPKAQPASEIQVEAVPVTRTVEPSTSAPDAEAAPPPTKRLRVISGQPAHVTGSDKRNCLDLPTNEAIMRCVYPRK